MKKKNVGKEAKLKIEIDLPEGHSGLRLVDLGGGKIVLVNENGDVVQGAEFSRSVFHDRESGKIKNRTVYTGVGDFASISGLEELASLEKFVVIDTNSKEIGLKKVSAAAFAVFSIEKCSGKYLISAVDGASFIYEFHDAVGNPEMLAISIFISEVCNKPEWVGSGVGIVNDSELGNHPAFNRREMPIYNNVYLPDRFNILYAGFDSGNEALNGIVKVLDKHSNEHLRGLVESGVDDLPNVGVLCDGTAVCFRCLRFDGLKIDNPEVGGIEVTDNTTCQIVISG
ncbi:hypothetical protein ACFPAG_05850 [Vogesella sp. GCM10023246]|uniref:Uncharacterized protein n=1 Tax=Vogesella oryzagri TaxID=3160864 RepID=A0ABV1M1M6_9NEIS